MGTNGRSCEGAKPAMAQQPPFLQCAGVPLSVLSCNKTLQNAKSRIRLKHMRISLRNSLYFVSAGAIGLVLFVYDWIRIAINLEDPVLNTIRDLFSILAFVFLYAAIISFREKKQAKPLETLRKLVAYGFFSAAIISTWGIILENKGNVSGKFVPQNIMQLVATTAFAFGIAAFVMIFLMLIGQIIYIKPDKKVRRRFGLFIGFAIAGSVLRSFRVHRS